MRALTPVFAIAKYNIDLEVQILIALMRHATLMVIFEFWSFAFGAYTDPEEGKSGI